jgi:hypothetical protein
MLLLLFAVSVLAQPSLPTSSPPSPSPSQQPSLRPSSAPTGSPSFHEADYDLYFTVVARREVFSNESFGEELRQFFKWPIAYAKFIAIHDDPDKPASQLIIQVKIDGDQANKALNRWEDSSKTTERSSATPYPLVELRTKLPHRGCPMEVVLDCQETAFQNAELIHCECDTGLTGLGVFAYVILPIALVIAIVVAICFFLPSCPLYQRPPVDRSKYKRPPQSGDGDGTKIAMDRNDSEA